MMCGSMRFLDRTVSTCSKSSVDGRLSDTRPDQPQLIGALGALKTHGGTSACTHVEIKRRAAVAILHELHRQLIFAQLTLWGAMAEKPGQELEAAVAGGAHPVLAVKVQTEICLRYFLHTPQRTALVSVTACAACAMFPTQNPDRPDRPADWLGFILQDARVGDFNGRSLSSLSSSVLDMDPDLPEAGAMRNWCAARHQL